MIKRILASSFLACMISFLHAQEISLMRGMKITKSSKIKKGNYLLPALSADKWVILIEGNGIVVDFNQVTLRGSSNPSKPDEFRGICVLLRNSKNVTIKNLVAKGYKIALKAENVENLIIEQCDFSYNYRKQLNSIAEKEDVSDWMSYHHNEKNEWLRYGAAIYLLDCKSAVIKNNRVTGGQNALMMTRCNDGLIFNNDFSFNSGIGLGMYRCNRNKVAFNKMNFNVRGYSYGIYNRGQDSAGILVYEQSNENLFYNNSVTHSGDGFFLWAGQTTMDTGKGGCNDNIIANNDFSYAPTNGIEVTFSRNYISGNRIFECDHGIWGGYSYETTITNNQFRNNRIGIAIEHGQDNRILYNLFSGDKEAIRLWARKTQPLDWGYAKNRDTRSRDYLVMNNSFNRNPLVYNLRLSERIYVYGNTVSGAAEVYKIDSTLTALDTLENEMLNQKIATEQQLELPAIDGAIDTFTGGGKYAGRKNIMITQWGPYDFRYPIIWNTNPGNSDTMKFDLLGPAGNWSIKKFRGLKNFSSTAGVFPAAIYAIRTDTSLTDIQVELEYRGADLTTVFGEKIPGNRPFNFSFNKFFQPIDWELAWFAIDTAVHNPIRTGQLFSITERKAPVKKERSNKIDYAWWGGIKADTVNYSQFITMAEGKAFFKPGLYELSVTWDDAVRIFVDGKKVMDAWNPSLYSFDESPNKKIRLKLGGEHQFRVEHVELGGFAALSLKFRPVP